MNTEREIPSSRRRRRPARPPAASALVHPLVVALLVVMGPVTVVAIVALIVTVAIRPAINVADDGGSIDNAAAATVQVAPGGEPGTDGAKPRRL